MILYIILVIQVLLLLFCYLKGQKKYKELVEEYKEEYSLVSLAPAAIYLFYDLKIVNLFEFFNRRFMQNLHRRIALIYGSREAAAHTRMQFGQLGSTILLLLLVFNLFAILDGANYTLFIYGVGISALAGYYTLKKVNDKIKTKRRSILIELPEFLNKIILLINAGETIQNAIIRTTERDLRKIEEEGKELSPLYKELKTAVEDLKLNKSFPQVMEEFSRRCGVHEVSTFTTTVVLNYRRGGEHLVEALREISGDLWDKRVSEVKTMGEEASSKLIIPMVLVFLVVAMIVAAPAFMML